MATAIAQKEHMCIFVAIFRKLKYVITQCKNVTRFFFCFKNPHKHFLGFLNENSEFPLFIKNNGIPKMFIIIILIFWRYEILFLFICQKRKNDIRHMSYFLFSYTVTTTRLGEKIDKIGLKSTCKWTAIFSQSLLSQE